MPVTNFASSDRLIRLAVVLMAMAAVTACRPAPPPPAPPVPPGTWAVVDGEAITREDVDKAYRRARDASQTVSEEETLTAKLSVLNDLIVERILLAKGRALKIEVPQGDLDTAYANAQKNIPAEAFKEELTRRNLTPDDMREGLRREMLTQKILEQEVGSKIAVTDPEISAFFEANRAQFNLAEESYHIAQIVVTAGRDGQPANATGDDAATPQEAAAKVRMLMERLKAGASFRDLAIGYSEDPESAPRGGDLGLVPVSKIKQTPPQLRDAVLNKTAGSVNVATSGGVYTLVLVVAHEQAGQRDLTTPGVRDRISGTLRGRKEQLLRAAYLTSVRSDATVVNHLARQLVESKGQMPGAPAAAATGK